ncbi:MAG: hypothetical protein WC374_04800 [Phycisphaerae bacterium]|jgi:hypothetical protein
MILLIGIVVFIVGAAFHAWAMMIDYKEIVSDGAPYVYWLSFILLVVGIGLICSEVFK